MGLLYLSGVLAHVGEDLQDDVAYHHFVVVATAGLLHTVILAAFHLMPMGMVESVTKFFSDAVMSVNE